MLKERTEDGGLQQIFMNERLWTGEQERKTPHERSRTHKSSEQREQIFTDAPAQANDYERTITYG